MGARIETQLEHGTFPVVIEQDIVADATEETFTLASGTPSGGSAADLANKCIKATHIEIEWQAAAQTMTHIKFDDRTVLFSKTIPGVISSGGVPPITVAYPIKKLLGVDYMVIRNTIKFKSNSVAGNTITCRVIGIAAPLMY